MSRQQISESLDKALSELAKGLSARDDPAAWRSVRDVLGWLYRYEQSEKNRVGESNYFAQKDADPAGKTLGG